MKCRAPYFHFNTSLVKDLIHLDATCLLNHTQSDTYFIFPELFEYKLNINCEKRGDENGSHC